MSLLTPVAGTGRKVCWLLPWYKATNPLTSFSVQANWNVKEAGAAMSFNDAMIQHSRNRLVDRFLAAPENFEWALFVDDDMVLPTGDPAWFRAMTNLRPGRWEGKLLDGLLRHGKTVVGALYMGRDPRGGGKAMFAGGDESALLKAIRKGDASGLQQVRWVGTGCLLVHRSVFTDIRTKFPHLRPKDKVHPWHYFTPMADSVVSELERVLAADPKAESITMPRDLVESALRNSLTSAHAGEDVVFCLRAGEAGHPVHVDLDVVCGHLGVQAWGPSNTA